MGRLIVFLCKGLRPLHPRGLNPGGTGYPCRLRSRRGGRGACPRAALVRPAPGERTISNAEVPLPRSPLSLAAGTAHRKACSIGFAPKRRLPAALGTCLSGTISAANGLMQGCRGRSPRRNKLKNLPLPTGKGGGGMGAGNQTKGRVGGRQSGQAPHRVPLTLAETATPGTSPPQGTTVAESSGNKKIPLPQQIPEWQDKADGARGHTPLPPARLINHLWYRVPRSI